MIDHTLVISPTTAFLFHLKQGFWLYAWPMLVGFLTIAGYQTLGRITVTGAAKWPVVFVLASVVAMISMAGWVMMVRGMHMIPFYGLGVGSASAIMSRVYAITLRLHPRLKVRLPRVIWRGDAQGIENLQKALRGRSGG